MKLKDLPRKGNKMKNLVLLRGVSGSGKSTFAQLIAEGLDCTIHCTDDYFMLDGVYTFNPADLGKNHQLCLDDVNTHMECRQENIVVANTFTQEWDMQPYIDLATQHSYRLFTVIVENRHGGESTHNVPCSVLEAQRERFEVKL